jgi:predicted ArsR family transcriptional regulator
MDVRVFKPRHTAKFHLDKLVEEDLLDTEFRRLSGRRGPGAGRPTKLYRRSARHVAVTIPPRRYDLAGQILADAVWDAARDGGHVREAVRFAAGKAGHRLGTQADPHGASDECSLEVVASVLAGHGYEARVEGAAVVLANCPFHALVREHAALVCGMNLQLISAMIDGLGCPNVRASLDPAPVRLIETPG